MEKIEAILDKCVKTMTGRNKSYGNSWEVLSISSLANLVEMKMNRIATLGAKATKTEDELVDSINYCIMALLKYYESQAD